MKKVFMTLSALLALNVVFAQQVQTDSLRNIKLEEVVVSATRAGSKTPVAYANIKQQEIEKQNFGQDIPYIIALSPSVTTTSDAGTGIGYTKFRIRGTDINRINVTINGVPYNDSESHGAFLVDLPDFASSLSSIQIQRGVGTSANGGAAFGASVNMKTNNTELNPYARVSSTFGSFNTLKNTLKAGTGLMNNHFAVEGRYSTIKSDGYIERAWVDMHSYMLSASYIANNTMLKLLTFGGREKTYQAWNGVDLDLVKSDPLNYARNYNDLGRYTDDNGQTQYYDNQTDNYTQTHYQLLLTQVFSPRLTLNATLHYTKGLGYYEEYKTQRKYVEYLLTPPVVDGEPLKKTDLIRRKWLDNDFYGMVFALNYKTDRMDMVFGGGANQYKGDHFGKVLWVRKPNNFDPGKDWYRNDATKNDWNIYLKTTTRFTDNLYGFADLQYRQIGYDMKGLDDKFDEKKGTLIDLTQSHTFSFFNPKAGLTYSINDKNDVYASFGIANREPNRKNYTNATSDEEPTSERLYDTEVGYRYHSPKVSFGTNFYYMKYKDQLILTGKLSQIGEALTTNVPESYRAGVEFSTAVQFHPMLRWDANLTLSQNKIENFTEDVQIFDDEWEEAGRQQNEIGKTNISYSPSVIFNNILTFNYHRFETSLQSSYVSRQYIDNTSSKERSIDPYFVNNLRVGYQFKLPYTQSVQVGLLVNNLFNAEYETNGYIWYSYYRKGERTDQKRYFPQAGTNLLANVVVNF